MTNVAYVYGNGPSLNSLLPDIKMHDAFWVNEGYKVGGDFHPDYYLVSDYQSFKDNHQHYLSVKARKRKFFRRDVCILARTMGCDLTGIEELDFHVAPTMDEGYFCMDLSDKLYRGFTVALDAIQVAFCLGYRTVYVGGVDLDYTTPHFYGGEQPKVQMPIARVIKSFEVARGVFERNGRELFKITDSPKLPLERYKI